jgi:hypothetical protein
MYQQGITIYYYILTYGIGIGYPPHSQEQRHRFSCNCNAHCPLSLLIFTRYKSAARCASQLPIAKKEANRTIETQSESENKKLQGKNYGQIGNVAVDF